MSHVPSWIELSLLTLAAFRVTRLIGWDSITEAWRTKIVGRKRKKPSFMQKMLACPWCLGWWVSLTWWGAWMIEPHWVTVTAVPWALSALVGLIAVTAEP